MNGRACAIATAAIVSAAILGCGGGTEEGKSSRNDAKAIYDLAFEKYQKGYYNEAVALYKRALEVDQDLSKAHFDLGLIYDDYLPDNAKAIYHYSMYLKLEPDAGKASMVREWIEKARGEASLAPSGPTPTAEVVRDDQAEYAASSESARIQSLELEIKAYLATIDELRKEVKRLTALQSGDLAEGGPPEKEKESLQRKYEKEKIELLEKFERDKDKMRADQERANARIKVLEAQLRGYESQKRAKEAKPSTTAKKSAPATKKTSATRRIAARPTPTAAKKPPQAETRRGVTIPSL